MHTLMSPTNCYPFEPAGYLQVLAPLLVEGVAEELHAVLDLELVPRPLVQAIFCCEHAHTCMHSHSEL